MPSLRILWLSNKMQSERDSTGTGSWLDAMARELTHCGEVQLGNIAHGSVPTTTRQDYGPVQQWIVPSRLKLGRNGLPSREVVAQIVNAVHEFSPDLIHVWGTEGCWGLLTARGLLKPPALLEMQGLKGAIAKVFAGDLSLREQMACVGPKEILRRSTIPQGRKKFAIWGAFEREMILGHRFITTQSDWLEAQVRAINGACRVFHNDFALRTPFHSASPWQPTDSLVVFCSAAYPAPFKGLHIAIRAIGLLARRFPEIQLRIAGVHQRPGIRRDGYIAWVEREVKRRGLMSNVRWLGPLPATEIASELQRCSAVVLPTFIEGYCLALAEAMILGAPAVAGYTGGTSYLAQDGVSALFFPLGDEAMCAYQLERILTNPELATHLSDQSRAIALVRNDRERIVQNQLAIYHEVIGAVTEG